MLSRLPAFFREEDHFYAPFVAGALFFSLVAGFPLGILVAHAWAQRATLDGRLAQVQQLHGHIQLMGWFGLFAVGMGYRLVARFTAVHVRPPALVPLTFLLLVGGLALRTVSQPWALGGVYSVLFALSSALEAAAALIFAAMILRSILRGRAEHFGYSPFFASGALWAAVAMMLNMVFVIDAAQDAVPVIPPARSAAIAFALLYGFVAMFIVAVSLRTFPIFFGRREASRNATRVVCGLLNLGVAAYAAAAVWPSYDDSADLHVLQSLGFTAAGAALVAMVVLLRVFEGTPHRLRESARRSMNFVRSAYFWLLVAGGLQVYFGARALWADRAPAYYETDAVRHFLALGFVSMVIMGMAFLVLPRLAMRRLAGSPARLVAPVLLALLYGAAAARGAGGLLVNEAKLDTGFWTMSAGGVFGFLAVAVFVGYLVWNPPQPEIPLRAQPGQGPSDQPIVL